MNAANLAAPHAMLFDWHGTLVNSYGPMYRAIEELLRQLDELDLTRHIIPESQADNEQDEKLLRYLRIFRRLHPDILAERRISRTDIFDVLFGDNAQAKAIAHARRGLDLARSTGDPNLIGRHVDFFLHLS